jgi:hypothetical protein
MRLRLTIAGADTVLASESCASCTYSPAGCCVAPPRYDWSDLGRVVLHGGAEWLLAGIAAGRLVPMDHGLSVRREKRRVSVTPLGPRIAKCTFHDGARGCTIEETHRPSTCNFYLCEHALTESERAGDDSSAARARGVHASLVADFVRWDADLEARVRADWPAERRFTAEFFVWLGEAFAGLSRRTG